MSDERTSAPRAPRPGGPIAALAGACLAVLAAGSAPGARATTGVDGAAAAGVTLFAQPRVADWTSPVSLFGAVTSHRSGETVGIQAEDCGSPAFVAEAQVTTRDGGGWFATFSSGVNSVVRAVWRGRASLPVAIGQRPSVVLERSAGEFRVGIPAKRSLWRRRVTLERRVGSGWKTVRRIVLTDARATSGDLGWTEATFAVDVPKGTLLRAVLPRSEAMPCYLGGMSRTVRA